jgi:hypothetical protein
LRTRDWWRVTRTPNAAASRTATIRTTSSASLGSIDHRDPKSRREQRQACVAGRDRFSRAA